MRTLLDLAAVWPDEKLFKALTDMHRRRLIDVRSFRTWLDGRSAPNIGTLRELVATLNPDRPIVSDGATVLLEIIREAGLPIPCPEFEVPTKSGSRYLDFAYPDHRLALEVDGATDHARETVFLDDRDREELLRDLDWDFERFTGRQLNNRAKCATRIGLALNLFPTSWRR
jgi:hypothetical protein